MKPQKKEKQKTNKTYIIVATSLIVLVSIFAFLSSDYIRTGGVGNSQENLVNLGIVAEKNGSVFMNDYATGNRLYRIDSDDSKMLLTNDYAKYINVIGDQVYYVNFSDDFKIYKINKDGTEREPVNDSIGANTMVIKDRWIYFSNTKDLARIYKMKLDGSELQKITDDTSVNFVIDGDWIYYSNESDPFDGNTAEEGHSHLYKIKTDGTGRQKVADMVSWCVSTRGDYVYFINSTEQGPLYRIKKDGSGEPEKIIDKPIQHYYFTDDSIYFTGMSVELLGFYKADLNGKNIKQIIDSETGEPYNKPCYSISRIGDWMYFVEFGDTKYYRYNIKTEKLELVPKKKGNNE